MDTCTYAKPTLIAGTGDIGSCYGCDFIDTAGKEQHIEQYQLLYCQNRSCSHLCCTLHIEPCGYCLGCCAELHGLGGHQGGAMDVSFSPTLNVLERMQVYPYKVQSALVVLEELHNWAVYEEDMGKIAAAILIIKSLVDK